MRRRNYMLIALFSLSVLLIVASFQKAPGYMDADYYYAGGVRLAEGRGFSEEILWNYLDDPKSLPHPSHAYWMPVTSIMAAIGMRLFGSLEFYAARFGSLLFALLVPPLTAALSFSITGRREMALLAGVLAVFPGFYLPYLPTTDAFGLYMVLGVLFFLSVGYAYRPGLRSRRAIVGGAFLLGLITGLMHLTRADGLIWLMLAMLALGLLSDRKSASGFHRNWRAVGLCGLGYLMVIGPWMLRNRSVFGTLLSPGGARALWILNYDELFIYPGSMLTLERWWNSGVYAILQARLWASAQNLQTIIAVQGGIIFLPLILIGLWQYRHDVRVRLGVAAWMITFLVMTLIFPFQGARGGFFHSGAALQPLFWAVIPVGLGAFVSWGSRIRGWNEAGAYRVFQWGLVGLALFLSAFVSFNRVLGSGGVVAWNSRSLHYAELEEQLVALGALPGEIVMVNNSPGYYTASRRPAISIPYGDLDTTLTVAERYQAFYLLLEFNQLQGEDDLYSEPSVARPGLHYLTTLDGTHIFKIIRQ